MKKALALLLALLLCLAAVACSSAPAESSSAAPDASEAAPESSEAAEEEPVEEPAEEPSGEVAEIRFWDMAWGPAGVYDVACEELIAEFEKEFPNIDVTYEFHAWDNYYQEYLTAVTSGMAPDVSNGAPKC